MTSCLFVYVSQRARRLAFGLLLAVLALPTLAENLAQGKADTAPGFIGLILPLNAPAFRQPAEVVKQGFLTAAQVQLNAPAIRIYPTGDDVNDILAVYRQALDDGAHVIVGPLTKNAVAALAEADITLVPTLALSVPDTDVARPNLYLFGLSLEAEARQVAQFIANQGHHSVLVVGAATMLDNRLQTAFDAAWQRLGGQVAGQIKFTPKMDLEALHEQVTAAQPDAIFLAANAPEARLIHPYLPETIASYATSQVFGGERDAQHNIDLSGVRFLDMPWLLQPDHPAVMVYPRAAQTLGADGERLYALGIDAFRLAQLFFRGTMPAGGNVLDGVTGQISLSANRQFTRQLTAAEFQDNIAVVLDHAQP